MYCSNCGKKVSDQAVNCPDCGHPLKHLRPGYEDGKEISPKSRLVAILLAVFIGSLGIHRFYVGKVGTGIAMIFTFGGLDANWLYARGLPTVTLGAGQRNAHTVKERLHIQSFVEGCAVALALACGK